MRAVGPKEEDKAQPSDEAPKEPSGCVVVVNILRGELLLAPWWCVNEGTTSWVFAFADANSATNDQLVSLTKSASKLKKIINIIKKSWKIVETLGIENRLAVSCHKMRALVNNTRNSTILCQHMIIRLSTPNVSREHQSEIFENFMNFIKNSMELRHTKLSLEIMSKLDKLTLEIMQPARDPSNCIDVVEYQLPLAGTRP